MYAGVGGDIPPRIRASRREQAAVGSGLVGLPGRWGGGPRQSRRLEEAEAPKTILGGRGFPGIEARRLPPHRRPESERRKRQILIRQVEGGVSIAVNADISNGEVLKRGGGGKLWGPWRVSGSERGKEARLMEGFVSSWSCAKGTSQPPRRSRAWGSRRRRSRNTECPPTGISSCSPGDEPARRQGDSHRFIPPRGGRVC